MTNETKVGMFLLFAFGLIGFSVIFLGDVHLFKKHAAYNVDFRDVQALPPKAAVKVAGVEIGKVHAVKLAGGRARVVIWIDPAIEVHTDASSRIGSTGVIGSRFVVLDPGTLQAPVLPEGSTIHGRGGGSLEQMIGKLSSLFEEDRKYGNALDNLKAILANIRGFSDALNTAVGQRSKDLEVIVTNFRDLTQSAKGFAQDLEEITREKKDDFKEAIVRFRSLGEKLDSILSKIDKGEGTIGALVSDKQTAADVKETISSLRDTAKTAQKVVGRLTRIDVYWNYRYRYDFRDDEGRSDVSVTFVPNPRKFYALGATNLGDAPTNEKHVSFERKNRIMAVMGVNKGPLTGYAGIIRSDGGLGGSFRPFWKSKKWGQRVVLNVEASDFQRDRVVQGIHLDRTFVSASGNIALKRWLWVGVRGEDMLERPAFMGYTNIVFRDEDIAYLLGLAQFAR